MSRHQRDPCQRFFHGCQGHGLHDALRLVTAQCKDVEGSLTIIYWVFVLRPPVQKQPALRGRAVRVEPQEPEAFKLCEATELAHGQVANEEQQVCDGEDEEAVA